MYIFRLYLGRKIGTGPDAREVTGPHLDSFLADTVAPVWPGFTVIGARGYWNHESEPTTILEHVCDHNATETAVRLAEHYAARFDQESVLLIAIGPKGPKGTFVESTATTRALYR